MKGKPGALNIICLICMLFLCACGGVSVKWQEQYDLGMKYLLEEDYEEAVLAFTAAIEIEPRLPEAYIGRGDAYVGLSNAEGIEETDKNAYCDLALEDYIAAIGVKDDIAEYYEKLMGAYYDGANIDMERLKQLLETGIEKTGSEELQYLLDIMETPMGNFKNEDFRYFYKLDVEGQEEIKAMVAAVSSGSEEEAKVALRNTEAPRLKSGEQLKRIRTYYGGYKIDLYKNIENQANQAWKAIEVRPKEGKGYYYSISNGHGEDFIIGEFADWNWNGEFLNESEGDFSYAIRGTAENGRICGMMEHRNSGEWEPLIYYDNGHSFNASSSSLDIVPEGEEIFIWQNPDGTVMVFHNKDNSIATPVVDGGGLGIEEFEKWYLWN